jgi:hypothetical protein
MFSNDDPFWSNYTANLKESNRSLSDVRPSVYINNLPEIKLSSPTPLLSSTAPSFNSSTASSFNSNLNMSSRNEFKSSNSPIKKPTVSINPPKQWNVYEQPNGHYGVKQPTVIDKIYGATNSEYQGNLNAPNITVTSKYIKWETKNGFNSTYNKQKGTWNDWTF